MLTSSFVRGVVGLVAIALVGNMTAACGPAQEEQQSDESTSALEACACELVDEAPAEDADQAPSGDPGSPPASDYTDVAPVGSGFASGLGMRTVRPLSGPGQCIKWGANIIDKLRKNKKFVAGAGGTFIVIDALADVKGAIDAIKDLLGVNSGLIAKETESVQNLLKDIEAINALPGMSEEGKKAAINALLKAAQGVCEKK